MKKIALLALSMAAVIGLTACGNQLSVNKATYKQSGMVAVIKGKTAGHDTVHYTAATTKGSAKVNGDTYVVSVPASTKDQTVTIKAGSQKVTTKVKAAKAIMPYKQFATTFNQAVVATALPKDVQKQLQTASKNKGQAPDVAAMTPAQKAAYAKQQQALQAAMVKAQTATKAQQLPTTATGLKQILKSDSGSIRANVQDGQLIALTDVASVKAMKDKTKKTAFGTQFALLATAAGANAKDVLKAFADEIKDANSGSTTTKTITSNGVKFNLGLSASDLYIYITK